MSEPFNLMPAELCDQKCGTIDCHQYGCIILNSEAPNKAEKSETPASLLSKSGLQAESVLEQSLAANNSAEAGC